MDELRWLGGWRSERSLEEVSDAVEGYEGAEGLGALEVSASSSSSSSVGGPPCRFIMTLVELGDIAGREGMLWSSDMVLMLIVGGAGAGGLEGITG